MVGLDFSERMYCHVEGKLQQKQVTLDGRLFTHIDSDTIT